MTASLIDAEKDFGANNVSTGRNFPWIFPALTAGIKSKLFILFFYPFVRLLLYLCFSLTHPPVLFDLCFASCLLRLKEASYLRVLLSFHLSATGRFFYRSDENILWSLIMYVNWVLPQPSGGHQRTIHPLFSHSVCLGNLSSTPMPNCLHNAQSRLNVLQEGGLLAPSHYTVIFPSTSKVNRGLEGLSVDKHTYRH